MGVDQFFGEMALIDLEARSATAVAKTDCSLVPINEKRFLYMVEETPFFAITVMRVLSRRLRAGTHSSSQRHKTRVNLPARRRGYQRSYVFSAVYPEDR